MTPGIADRAAQPPCIPELADLVALTPGPGGAVAALCPEGRLDSAIDLAREKLGSGGHLLACVPNRNFGWSGRQARKRLEKAGFAVVSVHAWVPTPRYRVLLVPVRDRRMLRFAINLHFPGSGVKRLVVGLAAALVTPSLVAPFLVVVARAPAKASVVKQVLAE